MHNINAVHQYKCFYIGRNFLVRMYAHILENIRKLLKKHPEGLTLSDIGQKIGVHRNSVSKYLDVLLTAGAVQLRAIGRAKLYTLAKKVPLQDMMNITGSYNILVDKKDLILQYSKNITSLSKENIMKGTTLSKLKNLSEIANVGKHHIGKKYYETRRIQVILENAEQGTMIIIEDITTTHQQNEQVKLLSRAVESSASGIVITDMHKKDQPIIYINPAFEKITGYSKKEVLGKNCRFLQGKKLSQDTKKQIKNTIEKGEEGRFTILNYRKDGTAFWNELFLAPVKDELENITHYVGVQSDVTYRHQV